MGRYDLVVVETVLLNFEEEIVLAVDVLIVVGGAASVFILARDEVLIDVAAEAGTEADEAFGMGGEEFFVDAGLVVEAVEESGGDEAVEVFVAFLILTKQDEVVVAVGFSLVLVSLLGDVDFASDDGVDAFGFGGVVEFDGSEEVAVVGHGDGGHFLLGDDVHHLGDFAGSIEEGVVGVAV